MRLSRIGSQIAATATIMTMSAFGSHAPKIGTGGDVV